MCHCQLLTDFFSLGDDEGSAIRCQDAKASSAQIEAKLKAGIDGLGAVAWVRNHTGTMLRMLHTACL